MIKKEKFDTAQSLKLKSEECRQLGRSLPAGEQRSFNLSTQLYHAANAFSLWQDSHLSSDYDLMIEFTDNLEQAAIAYAEQ